MLSGAWSREVEGGSKALCCFRRLCSQSRGREMGVLCLAALCPSQFGRGSWSLAGPGSIPLLGLAVPLTCCSVLLPWWGCCAVICHLLLWHLWELHAPILSKIGMSSLRGTCGYMGCNITRPPSSHPIKNLGHSGALEATQPRLTSETCSWNI